MYIPLCYCSKDVQEKEDHANKAVIATRLYQCSLSTCLLSLLAAVMNHK